MSDVSLDRVGMLPSRLKVLYITTAARTGGWLAEAFATDNATQIFLEESIGAQQGLERLRDEVFDAVLISHEPDRLDALELIEGLRAGGSDEPMIVLGLDPPEQLDAECYEAGADAYCCVTQTTTRSLLWMFSRAMERTMLLRENRRMKESDRQRLTQEHREAERLLKQQRDLVRELEKIRAEDNEHPRPHHPVDVGLELDGTEASKTTASPVAMPQALIDHYREMLRTYVVMGQGNLNREMTKLADLLATADISASETVQLHVHVLEELVGGLGNRSARHVLSRADLLILEVTVYLADLYRDRYHERKFPAQQQFFPGFWENTQGAAV